MDLNGINELHQNATQKINNSDFKTALSIINEIKDLGSNYYISYIVSSLLIDIGVYLGEDLIKEGIDLLENDKEEMISKGINSQSIYYNLANGYSNLFKFKAKINQYYYYFKDSELDNAIKYYREALNYGSPNPEVYVNIGNQFHHVGRVIDALDYYQKALNLKQDHAIALGNKAIALSDYAQLSGEHERTFLLEAYFLLYKALDLKLTPEAYDVFSNNLKIIKSNFQEEELKNPPEFKGYKKPDSEYDEYLINYCLKNKLYLNICNFCQKCDACVGDSALIRQMITPINKTEGNPFENDPFIILSDYLNQIKQDYVTARFLLILSRKEKINLDFVDKRVKITDTLNYNMYNVYIQLAIFAFKSLYDVLDKIAYFIDEYLELNNNKRRINFRTIWYKDFNKKIIHEKIENTRNMSLNALFNIYKDLEGSQKILKNIRNAITHRFIQIRMFCDTENDKIMKEETLVKHTLELAKIVRNAILYLLHFVNIEESRKRKKIANKNILTGTFVLEDLPDDLKSDRHFIK